MAWRGHAIPVLPLALHAAASVLVFRLTLLSAGSDTAARFASSIYAVRLGSDVTSANEPVASGAAVVAGLLALVLALRVRPDHVCSAIFCCVAIVLSPAAVPLVLVIALATRRIPPTLLLALALAVVSRLVDLQGALSPSAGAPPALALPPVVLAVALAIALRPGVLGLRAGVWCAGLVAFALPWGSLLHGGGAGAVEGYLMVAVAGLAAEAARTVRPLLAPEWLAPALEAAVVVLVAVRSW